jgi:hypothetical protein
MTSDKKGAESWPLTEEIGLLLNDAFAKRNAAEQEFQSRLRAAATACGVPRDVDVTLKDGVFTRT